MLSCSYNPAHPFVFDFHNILHINPLDGFDISLVFDENTSLSIGNGAEERTGQNRIKSPKVCIPSQFSHHLLCSVEPSVFGG
jgi:hypothetical protein